MRHWAYVFRSIDEIRELVAKFVNFSVNHMKNGAGVGVWLNLNENGQDQFRQKAKQATKSSLQLDEKLSSEYNKVLQ